MSNHSAGLAARAGVGAAAGGRPAAVLFVARAAGAGLLLGMAWIHWHLYFLGFRSIAVIGPAFMANALMGTVAAAAVLVTPTRWVWLAAAGGALLDAGTLSALGLSFTVGLFGFHESSGAPLLPATIIVEVLGALELAWLAWHYGALGDRVARFAARRRGAV